MTSQKLPKPNTPYKSWGEFTKAVWYWGLHYMDPAILDRWLDHAHGEMTKPRKDDAHLLRPSANLNCEMKLHLLKQGFKPQSDKRNLGPTFNVGHLLHAHFFAQVESALPEGFLMSPEQLVNMAMIDWWPKDPAVAKQEGSADLLLTWGDDAQDEAHAYFGDRLPARTVLIDVKSTADHIWKQKYKQPLLGTSPDSFGYESQLAMYHTALGLEGSAYFAYVNRNILSGKNPPAMVEMSARQIAEELERVKRRVTESTPSPEMLLTWGRQVSWVCGAFGKSMDDAMCDFCVPCSEFWPVEIDV